MRQYVKGQRMRMIEKKCQTVWIPVDIMETALGCFSPRFLIQPFTTLGFPIICSQVHMNLKHQYSMARRWKKMRMILGKRRDED